MTNNYKQKWHRVKIEGFFCYSLKISENFIFQIEPTNDGEYLIWFAAHGWLHEFLVVKSFKSAKSICNEIAIIIKNIRKIK
uniref:Uncharacterized protein n=1 Tax=viral metagenome TaxID=1070528 RepID=A0A6H2A413_9ZZZZ